MKQLPCMKQNVLEQRLKTIITMTINVTNMFFNANFYPDPHAQIDLQNMRVRVFKFEYIVRTNLVDVNTMH